MAEEQTETTKCPYCKEEIKADALVCKHCRSTLQAARPDHGGTCPYCKEDINPEATRCKHCGSDLEARAARAEGGCGCGSWADAPYAYRARGQFFDRQLAGGQCHDRCILACGSSSPGCEWLCNWICEGAPVVQAPQFVIR
jgi:predicted amidophosphoribosyltransferase